MELQDLFRQMCDGDSNALFALHHVCKHRLTDIATCITEQRFASHNIVADVFIRIWKEKENLRDVELPEVMMTALTIVECGKYLCRAYTNPFL